MNLVALRRGGSSDRGTTLTELLVVMLILGIIVAATATLTIGFQRTNAQNISRQDQIDAARTAVERMSKTVRTAVKPSQLTTTCVGCLADAFVKAEDFSVQFYANLDNTQNTVGPRRITYTVATTGADAGVLIEKSQVPESNVAIETGYEYCDAEAAGADAGCVARLTSRRITPGVLTVSGMPLFKYYDEAGVRMTPVAGASLTAVELEKVLSIELVVTVQSTNATKAAPTTYIQRVMMPNSEAVLRSGAATP